MKTALRPILRTPHQTAPHRISVQVTQLLDPLGLAPNTRELLTAKSLMFIDISHYVCTGQY
jgi:hypothetical protein